MRKSKFRKHLELLEEDELRRELDTLYEKIKAVREYYVMELGTAEDRKVLYDRAKSEIKAKYATKSYRKPRRPRIQKINYILSEMKKKSVFSHEMTDLYLFDVEAAILFMRQYDFFSEVLANHVISVFEEAIRLVRAQRLEGEWLNRCGNIVAGTRFLPGVQIELDRIFQEASANI